MVRTHTHRIESACIANTAHDKIKLCVKQFSSNMFSIMWQARYNIFPKYYFDCDYNRHDAYTQMAHARHSIHCRYRKKGRATEQSVNWICQQISMLRFRIILLTQKVLNDL